MTVGGSCVVDFGGLVTVSPPLCPVEGPVLSRVLSFAVIVAQEFDCPLFDISPFEFVLERKGLSCCPPEDQPKFRERRTPTPENSQETKHSASFLSPTDEVAQGCRIVNRFKSHGCLVFAPDNVVNETADLT